MAIIRKTIDFYLYSSIHIALGAALSVILCYACLKHIPTSDYAIFVLTGTIFIYSLHRLFGIRKVKLFENEGRFAIIKKFKLHILIYAILSGAASLYFFYSLDRGLQILLFIPAFISFLYVVPFFSSRKRLRDFNYIKIFLISITWGMIIGIIPYLETGEKFDFKAILYFFEKMIFIFAITLPFDVRDIRIDNQNQVKTIPTILGAKKSYILSYFSLLICVMAVWTNYLFNIYNLSMSFALTIGYLITAFLIRISYQKKDDYYFSGILDGAIHLVAILGIIVSGILSVIF